MSKKICLCVGHGKNAFGKYDPGAVSKDGKYHEHKLAAAIARYAAEYLQCDLVNADGSKCLSQRIKAVNAGDYDFAADIHLNAGGGTGTETFYYHGSPTGKKAADLICGSIAGTLGVRNRGAKVRLNSYGSDYFGFIRSTKPCAVLIETVFIDNSGDLAIIRTDSGCRKCGEAIGKALEKLFASGKKYRVTAEKLRIRKSADSKAETASFARKGDILTLTVTSSDGKWGRVKDGGWIPLDGKSVREVKG